MMRVVHTGVEKGGERAAATRARWHGANLAGWYHADCETLIVCAARIRWSDFMT
jgi:hypothetical protein